MYVARSGLGEKGGAGALVSFTLAIMRSKLSGQTKGVLP